LTSSTRVSPAPYSTLLHFTLPPTSPPPTLSLHDALPISWRQAALLVAQSTATSKAACRHGWLLALPLPLIDCSRCRPGKQLTTRSEEHTSELQSRVDLVCRLLLEKKKRGSEKSTAFTYLI